MITFKKEDKVKYIDENSSLINILKADGWEEDKPEVIEVKEEKISRKPKGK